MTNTRSYYCSKKFTHIKVDFESFVFYNCHTAKSHPVDFDLLIRDKDNLFNHPISIKEREQMLNNVRCDSCENCCWFAEDNGSMSVRLLSSAEQKTHTTIVNQPEVVDIGVNSDCNLSCLYCCEELSSSWRNDILQHGPYDVDKDHKKRYQLSKKSVIKQKVSQKKILNSKNYQILFDATVELCKTAKRVKITGGEPLLYNRLFDLLDQIPSSVQIEIFTGLGISDSRLDKILNNLVDKHNITLTISAEGTDKFLELVRYGSSWDDFNNKIAKLEDKKIKFGFFSTLSNVSILDFDNFYQKYKKYNIEIAFCYTPRFLSPFVLDKDTKQNLVDRIHCLPEKIQKSIKDSIEKEPSEQDRKTLSSYLHQYYNRRNKDLTEYFPYTFKKWINL